MLSSTPTILTLCTRRRINGDDTFGLLSTAVLRARSTNRLMQALRGTSCEPDFQTSIWGESGSRFHRSIRMCFTQLSKRAKGAVEYSDQPIAAEAGSGATSSTQ